MKRQKRDRSEHVFVKGFQTGAGGRSLDLCPYQDMQLRHRWLSGWREGRAAFHQGLSGVSLIGLAPGSMSVMHH